MATYTIIDKSPALSFNAGTIAIGDTVVNDSTAVMTLGEVERTVSPNGLIALGFNHTQGHINPGDTYTSTIDADVYVNSPRSVVASSTTMFDVEIS